MTATPPHPPSSALLATTNKMISKETITASTTMKKKRNKRRMLNKFLTKTYHMISEADPSVASWSSAGDSFTIRDLELFEKEYLPKYFNHSNLSSFVRQLNFYQFTKLRTDADLQEVNSNNQLRFSHQCFRKGQIDLLHHIKRSTATSSDEENEMSNNEEVEALRKEVATLKQKVANADRETKDRMTAMAAVMLQDFNQKLKQMETYYETMIQALIRSQSIPR